VGTHEHSFFHRRTGTGVSAPPTQLRVEAAEQVRELIAEVKPRLRGWLHLGSIPLTLAAGVVLVVLSPTASTRVGAIVFMSSALALFSVSALYHRGTWSTQTCVVLRRLDHANIFLLIAGSYTAYALLLLQGKERAVLLTIVWTGAALGMVFRVCWVTAPRWLHTPIYFVLGYGAVLFTPGFLDGASHLHAGIGVATLVMLATGGALYTVGGVVYGFQRPNPWPTWFGFHEVFHTLTVLAFASHYIGVCLATFSLR
jgi:hemolysin III